MLQHLTKAPYSAESIRQWNEERTSNAPANELKYGDSVPAIIAPPIAATRATTSWSAPTARSRHVVSAIQLDLFLAIPEGRVGAICDRSSMAQALASKCLAASWMPVIAGRVVVVLVNLTDRPCILDEGATGSRNCSCCPSTRPR